MGRATDEDDGGPGRALRREVDAFLILVLSVFVARSAGAWVLAIGAARYVFLAAGWPLPWMREPLPARHWRKFVAATQGIILAVAAADVLPPAAGAGRARRGPRPARRVVRPRRVVAVGPPGHRYAHAAVADPDRRPRGRDSRRPGGTSGRAGRKTIAVALTVLAALLVWVALVAPDRPRDLTLIAFLRIPLEGLVLIALAVLLPAAPRRIVAVTAGVALTLLVVLKILDFGFFTAFNRPFEPIGDTSSVGIGIETLGALVGRTEANLIIVGIGVGAVALVPALIVAMLRLTRIAADNRRWTFRAWRGARRRLGGLLAVWRTAHRP